MLFFNKAYVFRVSAEKYLVLISVHETSIFSDGKRFFSDEREFSSTPCIHAEEEKETSRDHIENAVNCSTELYIPRLVVLEVNERCHCEKWDSGER